MRCALDAIADRLPALRLAVPEDELKWAVSPLFHGVEKLPVAWD